MRVRTLMYYSVCMPVHNIVYCRLLLVKLLTLPPDRPPHDSILPKSCCSVVFTLLMGCHNHATKASGAEERSIRKEKKTPNTLTTTLSSNTASITLESTPGGQSVARGREPKARATTSTRVDETLTNGLTWRNKQCAIQTTKKESPCAQQQKRPNRSIAVFRCTPIETLMPLTTVVLHTPHCPPGGGFLLCTALTADCSCNNCFIF